MKLSNIQQYSVVTANYWAFTLTDGALRLLVVGHFHELGYTTLQIALLFLFYEFFGIITNLYGGWIGARYGLRLTLWIGTILQIIALFMLIPVKEDWPVIFSVVYVMVAQAVSGIAKDLNKMSAKSAVKTVVPETNNGNDTGQKQLFKWVAILTGSKNALKGVGFFLGGLLYKLFGFNNAVGIMGFGLCLAFLLTLILPGEIGKMKTKPAFNDLFSKSNAINILSAARFFLFGARDVWFVVALPVFLDMAFGWDYMEIGLFLGAWVIGYGIVQASAPAIRKMWGQKESPDRKAIQFWSAVLMVIPSLIGIALWRESSPSIAIILGLTIFGFVFAMNSSTHSYMILAYSDNEKVSLNVGFYYMANAAGRLIGTLLSGLLFMIGRNASVGLQYCLYFSSLLIFLSWISSLKLPSFKQRLSAP
ncbi:organoarsenical effux MFS transporter ArsJ [uncultured Prochlorococcus sp.]|uniref:organoarsenical effux MFS transporter ArsJ n=1 Tax=uncultured Prochlorococcus sp. TaxID=159733 RepID=UPI00258A2D02|nr:organoarsenical effux MFS transporter ArsJ [uncultured Prochlorococcus sp.]